jgi:transposase
LDVHKRSVVGCVVVPGPDGAPVKGVRSFGTTTDELLALADWLDGCAVTDVALEATGVYWKPVWNLLEDRFALLLVNAHHVKASSADDPDRQHGLPRGERRGHRPEPSPLRATAPAA